VNEYQINGKNYFFEITTYPSKRGLTVFVKDITDRKKAEEAIRESEEKFRNLAEQSPNMIFINKKGRVVYANKKCEEMMGYKREEFYSPGFDFMTLIAPESQDLIRASFKKHTQGHNIPPYEYTLVSKKGHKIDAIITIKLINYDGERAILGIITDITEHKMTEQELRTKDWAIKSSISAISLADLQGNLIYVNDSFLRLWGYEDEKEVIGKPAIKFWRSEEEALKIIEALHDKWNWIGELEATKKDGSAFDAQLSASMVTDANGNPICMMASFIDITEHKWAERVQTSLYKISEAAHSAKNLEELYHSIHNIISELMPANNFYIALYDSASKMLSFPYFVDEYEKNPGPQKLGKGLTEYVLRTGKPLLASPKVFNELKKKGEVISVGPPSIDWLGVPLKTADAIIGVLTVQSYTEGTRYGEKDKSILTFISEQVAMAIERKKIERELKESEEKFRNLAEQSPNMIFINKKGKVVYANKKCEEMMGYKREEFYSSGFDFMTLIAPESRGIVQKSFTKHTKGKESLPYEYALLTKKGQRIEAILTTRLINYEGERAILGIVTDITQHKIAEEKYQSLYSAMNEGVCLHKIIYDNKGKAVDYRFTDINPAYESITGLKKEKVIGAKASQIYRTANPPFLNIYTKVAETREPSLIETYFPPLKKYFIISAFSPEKGTLATVYTDITERYETERELIDAKDQAETALRKLKRAQSQLIQSARLAALGKLSAGIAHEINNPLSIISGHAQILRMEKSPDRAGLKKTVEIIEKQVERASSITDQLLQFSKRIKPRLKRSDVNETLKDTLVLLKQQLSQDKIKIVKQLSSKHVFIQADSLQLQQVFLNLIVNASHAMPNGGTLTINTMVKDGNLEIKFTDTGCGIPERNLSKLFEPFFTTKKDGTGLGLSIAYGIIKAHEGDIKVRSEEGKGTTFIIILPYE
jgi:PAS domain S-box-containing protein